MLLRLEWHSWTGLKAMHVPIEGSVVYNMYVSISADGFGKQAPYSCVERYGVCGSCHHCEVMLAHTGFLGRK